MSKPGDTHQEEQEKLLEEAMNIVKQNSFQMKRCLDSGKLMDALKHCSTMLSELRTGLLSPKYYYELYMGVFDQLRFLEAYLVEEHKKGKKISDLYELVQYAGNIVPRLYLLITVGAVYIETNEAPTREILIDMVEMCRGVQHPTRGLFLRNYLSQMTKNKLPDNSTVPGIMNKNYSGLTLVSSSNPDGETGSLLDSIYFVMTNFTEMTKLWVRMQHQGHSKDRERREQERKELKILVGTNLVRLSELEGVDLEIYRNKILPNILEQVVSCKDVIAQDYLMEIIIQVFQDEFHLRTLQSYLEACAKLVKGVNVKGIITSLIDRLARYASSEGGGIPSDIPLFEIFSKQIQEIFDSRPDMLIQDIISLQLSLLNLSINCYPNRLDYVDQVLKVTYEKIKASSESKGIDKQNSSAGKQLIKLLTIPIDNYNNVLTLLKLENYAPIFSFLSYNARKSICIAVVENILKNETVIDDHDDASKLLDMLGPLIKDEEDKEEQNEDDFAEEQTLVARMVNLFKNESCDRQYQILTVIRKYFGAGGNRIKFTLPSLVFASLSLALKYRQLQEEDELWSKKAQKVFQFSHQTTSALSKSGNFEVALRLFLQCAQAADICMFETISYEFITQAFLIYEENISDSKAQLSAITLIIGTLQTTRTFNAENRDTLNTKCALYSTKLLKKPDQCYSVQLCSHLFWSIPIPGRDKFLPQGYELYNEGKRALECLQKSLKIADSCMESGTNVQLFVQILNRYLYFYEKGNESVTLKYINGLIDLIVTNSANLESKEESTKNTKTHFANTTQYIKFRKTSPLQGSLSMSDVETPSI